MEEDKQLQEINSSLEKVKKYKQNKYMIKLLVIVTILNIVLTYMNIHKYFFDPDREFQDTDLSHFRKNDQMNVALAARPYDQISDYFTAKSNLDNGYQIIKDGQIVPPKKDFPKTLGYIKHIRIGYTDWNDTRAMEYINYLKTNSTQRQKICQSH